METKTIAINGNKVRYFCGGKGKPLVFLHGWSTNPLSHKPLLEKIAEHFTVYAPFLFDLSFEDIESMAKSLAEFIYELGLKEVILAGTSFGALIACMAAYLQPKLVSRLLLINAAGVPSEASRLEMAFDALNSYFILLLQRKLRVILYRWQSGINFHLSFWRHRMRVLAKQLKSKTHICYIFHRLKVKTVIIWSTRDVTFPLLHAYSLKKMIPNSKLVVVEGTHAWHYHDPDLFAKTIVAACNSP